VELQEVQAQRPVDFDNIRSVRLFDSDADFLAVAEDETMVFLSRGENVRAFGLQ